MSSPAPVGREVALVDLLDRLLANGVVVAAEVTLSIAGVDLVHISLRALVTSVRAREPVEATQEGAA
jgi:Gas vesicle protein